LTDLGYRAFDADNHYYEAEDAFTRHIDPRMARRCMQWAQVEGRKRLLVGGKVNRFIPNPTFDPVAKPGVLDAYFRGKNPEAKGVAELFGDLEPINPAYRDRDVRLAVMDTQQLEAALFFPTLGVGMEESLKHDPAAVCAAFQAFNRWLHDDWGFAYRERIFGAPYMTLVNPDGAACADAAVAELDWALARDARVVVMRCAPVATAEGPRSLADPVYDPYWARANEAGITVAFHSGDAGYYKFAAEWGEDPEFKAFDFRPLRLCLSANPVHDAMAAILCHGLLDRHRNLRLATIEAGSSWVEPLLSKMKKAYGQMPMAFDQDPVEAFQRHVWVSPYYEDDLRALRDTIGADHVLFGSDYPHAEGLAEPVDFVEDLAGYSDAEIRLAMRDNGMGLIARRPV